MPQIKFGFSLKGNKACQIQQPQKLCLLSFQKSDLQIQRRTFVANIIFFGSLLPEVSAIALPKGGVDARVAEAFNRALSAGGDYEMAEKAWTYALEIDPTNSAAWSNRATTRLQAGRWQEAREDFLKSLDLEISSVGRENVSPLLWNNLGNAQGACGDWESAMKSFQEAAKDSELQEIAQANYALALFEVGQAEAAQREIQSLLRKDPYMLDMKCGLVAVYWAQGKDSAAEEEWEDLQQAQDGLGQTLYSSYQAVDRVKSRWPPRATAALEAFIAVSRQGLAVGYDGKTRKYDFSGQKESREIGEVI